MRTKIACAIIALVVSFSSSTYVAAAPDKKNPVSGQEVASLYGGKTWIWTKGGSHWGADGSFEAVFDGAVAVGKWYATNKGNVCYEAVWKKGANDAGVQIKRCWLHVRDNQGVMWKLDPETNEWYRPQKEFDERLKSGNQIRSEVRKLRQQTGL
jgi:hypothetical protein